MRTIIYILIICCVGCKAEKSKTNKDEKLYATILQKYQAEYYPVPGSYIKTRIWVGKSYHDADVMSIEYENTAFASKDSIEIVKQSEYIKALNIKRGIDERLYEINNPTQR